MVFEGLNYASMEPLAISCGSSRKVHPTRSEGWNVGSWDDLVPSLLVRGESGSGPPGSNGIWVTGSWLSFTKEGSSPPRGINAQVLLPRLDGRTDGRMEEDLLGIVCKHLEGHCMANVLSKANKMYTIFLLLRWKSSELSMPKINRLPKTEV